MQSEVIYHHDVYVSVDWRLVVLSLLGTVTLAVLLSLLAFRKK